MSKSRTIGTKENTVTTWKRSRGEGGYNHNLTNRAKVLEERILLAAYGEIGWQDEETQTFYIGQNAYMCRTPEEIDTFQGWKNRGYYVKRGQKAISELKLWSGAAGLSKPYYFFAASQVAKAR